MRLPSNMIFCVVYFHMGHLDLGPVESFKPLQHIIPPIAEIMPYITETTDNVNSYMNELGIKVPEDAVHLLTDSIVHCIVGLDSPHLDN